MFKRCKVVLLPTNKAENALIKAVHLNYYGNRYFTKEYLNSIDSEAFHLYILSDDKVKEGDWFMRTHIMGVPIDGIPVKADCDKTTHLGDYIMKIIASTDPSLDVLMSRPYLGITRTISSPSPLFIVKYISEYNKGNQIYDVMVEYDSSDDNMDNYVSMFGGVEVGNTLKVNPHDNTITIRKIKDTWTREEVEQQLVYCVSELAASFGHANTAELMKVWNEATHKWAKDNL
jgi:hypothetical protein